jgi:hypothetical protein
MHATTHSDCVVRANSLLSKNTIRDLRRLVVEQDSEGLVLRGRVSSFYHKQLAQELVRNELDGAPVVNCVEVAERHGGHGDAPPRASGARR